MEWDGTGTEGSSLCINMSSFEKDQMVNGGLTNKVNASSAVFAYPHENAGKAKLQS